MIIYTIYICKNVVTDILFAYLQNTLQHVIMCYYLFMSVYKYLLYDFMNTK